MPFYIDIENVESIVQKLTTLNQFIPHPAALYVPILGLGPGEAGKNFGELITSILQRTYDILYNQIIIARIGTIATYLQNLINSYKNIDAGKYASMPSLEIPSISLAHYPHTLQLFDYSTLRYVHYIDPHENWRGIKISAHFYSSSMHAPIKCAETMKEHTSILTDTLGWANNRLTESYHERAATYINNDFADIRKWCSESIPENLDTFISCLNTLADTASAAHDIFKNTEDTLLADAHTFTMNTAAEKQEYETLTMAHVTDTNRYGNTTVNTILNDMYSLLKNITLDKVLPPHFITTPAISAITHHYNPEFFAPKNSAIHPTDRDSTNSKNSQPVFNALNTPHTSTPGITGISSMAGQMPAHMPYPSDADISEPVGKNDTVYLGNPPVSPAWGSQNTPSTFAHDLLDSHHKHSFAANSTAIGARILAAHPTLSSVPLLPNIQSRQTTSHGTTQLYASSAHANQKLGMLGMNGIPYGAMGGAMPGQSSTKHIKGNNYGKDYGYALLKPQSQREKEFETKILPHHIVGAVISRNNPTI